MSSFKWLVPLAIIMTSQNLLVTAGLAHIQVFSALSLMSEFFRREGITIINVPTDFMLSSFIHSISSVVWKILCKPH